MRCRCGVVRYCICTVCCEQIDLSKGSVESWPYTCLDCKGPCCTKCANYMTRCKSGILCTNCDNDPKRTWVVLYRKTLQDRERHPVVELKPCPYQADSRSLALKLGLEFLDTFCAQEHGVTTIAIDIEAGFTKKKVGWVGAQPQISFHGSLRVEMGIFPLHPIGTYPLPDPQ